MGKPRVLIGAAGWAHPGWMGSFYPDDLPEDWRLAYYANLYRVVLVPAEAWLDPSAPAACLEEAEEGPGFLAEVPTDFLTQAAAGDTAALSDWLRGVSVLGDRLDGLILPPEAPSVPAPLLARLDETAPLAVEGDFPGADAFGRVWRGPPESPQLDRGRLAVARIGSPPPNPRGLREILEALLAVAGETRLAALIIEGEPPDQGALETAGTILDLL